MSVFGAVQNKVGAVRAQDCSLSVDGLTAGLLAVNSNLSFTQAVTMLFEIGSTNVYYVGGRAQGQATIGRVVGPGSVTKSFLAGLGDICSQHAIQLSGTSCNTGGKVTYNCQGAVLTSVAVQVTAQEIVMTETLQFIFADLTVS